MKFKKLECVSEQELIEELLNDFGREENTIYSLDHIDLVFENLEPTILEIEGIQFRKWKNYDYLGLKIKIVGE